jgi:hypothetical protein
MSATDDPVGAYVRALEAQLQIRSPRRRRRILNEVRAHLSEALDDVEPGCSRDSAAREAIARFGSARDIAANFNAARGERRPLARRLVTLWAAWIVAMGMGSMTVWAAAQGQQSSSAAHARSRPARVVSGEAWSARSAKLAVGKRYDLEPWLGSGLGRRRSMTPGHRPPMRSGGQ